MPRLPGPLLLAPSLRGGQAFRWRERAGGGYRGVIADRAIDLTAGPRGSVETPHAEDLPRLRDYFRLGDPYARDLARLARDPGLAGAIARHRGLRVLRQDPWETLAAFITSANNNVRRIEGSMEAIARVAGEPIPGSDVHAFPAPGRLARMSERALRACGLGYRAPFLRASASRIARGDLDLAALREAEYETARAALLALPGVGPKVADCVCLFALDKLEAFPVDRWIARVCADVYPGEAPARARDLGAWARERWGKRAGLAQQFLFHDARTLRARPRGGSKA